VRDWLARFDDLDYVHFALEGMTGGRRPIGPIAICSCVSGAENAVRSAHDWQQ
jgi:hypothetical protein